MGARPFFYMKFIATLSVDYSFEVNSIETKAPTFFGHINSFLGSVPCAKHAACSYNDPLFLLLPLFLLCFRLQTSSKKSRLKEPFYAFYLLADSNCHPDCSWLPTFFVIALFFCWLKNSDCDYPVNQCLQNWALSQKEYLCHSHSLIESTWNYSFVIIVWSLPVQTHWLRLK